MNIPTQKLTPEQVPEPPNNFDEILYVDILRWIIIVADRESSEMKWACRMIGRAYDKGLTDRQAEIARDIYNKVFELWRDDLLECQLGEFRVPHQESGAVH